MDTVFYASCTRIADLPPWPLTHRVLPRESWESGDYVVGRVLPFAGTTEQIELDTGREVKPLSGDLVVGTFARRAATLEAVGRFDDIEDNGLMHSMTEGGCFGRVTSRSVLSKPLIPLKYVGHVILEGAKSNMRDWVPEPPDEPYALPTVLVVGTSMSAGKTLSARVAVRQLVKREYRVVGGKVTGAGRFNDVMSLGDAGAMAVFDFVDAGLPTTVVPAGQFRRSMGGLLRRMGATGADVAVIEAGASPLEPYNGTAAVELLQPWIRFVILCASDPYAVVGIREAWGIEPDVVAGPAANTSASVDLVKALSGLEAMNLMRRESHARFGELLHEALSA
ncbi:MAG: hypothetical protein JSU98_13310 [Gemmatimonadales bacterium]|jgi:hypothetical protein|nr:MAG: hypothetical protein JSU98_13310 [Gemmatimonadales bacterium]